MAAAVAPAPAIERNPKTVTLDLEKSLKGTHQCIGGSRADEWNSLIADQAFKTLWKTGHEKTDSDWTDGILLALICIKPRDEFEGMLAAQMFGAHNAAMECYRRAMVPDQSFAGRQEALNQANKLSRTYAALLEALNRHRGKGQQKVTVEHVHVYQGGQAIVGAVEPPGAGALKKGRVNPLLLDMWNAPRCGAKTRSGRPCESPGMANGRCRMHGGPSPGAPKGNRNNFKHGYYSAEAVARRREISAMLRTARSVLIDAH
ncbi:HGGxSTG domain-containing protein [Bradyrhizobium lupini]|uniref:HGGxSTG domain-containing protein n=1 Tax=Rhizobium lupini TaxID=136996 RepID=UPI0034C5F9D1